MIHAEVNLFLHFRGGQRLGVSILHLLSVSSQDEPLECKFHCVWRFVAIRQAEISISVLTFKSNEV